MAPSSIFETQEGQITINQAFTFEENANKSLILIAFKQ